mmetsp:Transcript_3352/g.7423  ORF Transcript_3352/g.7423 Transcript_3352/m.7423 type:complete len:230 (+) Transcript_3352:841-1530(+)
MGTVCDENDENIVKIDFVLKDEGDDESLVSYWCHTGKSLLPRSDIGLNTTLMANASRSKSSTLNCQKLSLKYRIKGVFFERSSHHSGDMADFAKKVLQSNHFTKEVYFGTIKFTQEDVKTLCSAIKSRNMGSQSIKNLALCDCFDGGIDAHTLGSILTSVTSGSAKEVTLDLRRNMMTSREAGVIARFLTSNEVQVDNPHSFHLACLSRLTLVVFCVTAARDRLREQSG